jgi:hypothetical protein
MQLTNQDIEVVTNGFHKYIHKQFTQMISIKNAIKIAKYIQDQKNYQSLKIYLMATEERRLHV